MTKIQIVLGVAIIIFGSFMLSYFIKGEEVSLIDRINNLVNVGWVAG